MTTPQEDARMLGPERIIALVDALAAAGENNGLKFAARVERSLLEAAARRLATPEPAPKWPELVSVSFTEDGYFRNAWDTPSDIPGRYRARLVPLDGSRVVLTREEADLAYHMACVAWGHAEPGGNAEREAHTAVITLRAALAAASKEGTDAR